MNGAGAKTTPELSKRPEAVAPQAPTPQPDRATSLGALQASAGNAALAAAAADGSIPPASEALQLQSIYGNAAVTQAPTLGQTDEKSVPATSIFSARIVEDTLETLEPGQMKKSEFLAELKTAVCRTAAEVLAGTPWSENGCPYIEYWFAYYATQDAAHVERAARKYAPGTTSAAMARDYIRIISEHIRSPIDVWAKTGRITGVPGGLPIPLSSMAMAGPPSSGALPGSMTEPKGVPILPKAHEGGPKETRDPQAIQAQLGAGRPLEAHVQSRMGAAFGQDFSHVRMHTDAIAGGISSDLNARAFTIGEHMAFSSGEYQPGTLVGDALIAHELAHVVQQEIGGPTGAVLQKGETEYNGLEEDADKSAVGAVASIWGGVRGGAARIARNAMPSLRSGLRLQRCGGDDVDLSKFPTPDYAKTVQALRTLYMRKEAISRGEEPLENRAEVDSQIALLIEDLRFLGIRMDEDRIYEAVMKTGDPAEMRKIGGRIARTPLGSAFVGQRMTFTLYQDYSPPGRTVKLKWRWKDKTGKAFDVLLGSGFPKGESITLDDFFWNVTRPQYSKEKFVVFVEIYLGDEKQPAGVISTDEIKLETTDLTKFEIEPSTKVAIKGASVEFKIKGWALEWQDRYLEWYVDGKKADKDILVFKYKFEGTGKRQVSAKIFKAERGFWGTKTTLLQEASTEIEVWETVTVGEEALKEAAKLKPPVGLEEFEKSIRESMPEVGRRAALGGEQQKYWTERYKAKEEQAKSIADKIPYFKAAKPLPADLKTLDPAVKYTGPIPAVIVYFQAGIQPISIFLGLENSGGTWNATLIDATGKKVAPFTGSGSNGLEAATDAFKDWKADNPYPRGGTVVYTFSPPGWTFQKSFSTDSFGKDVEAWVDGILTVGGILVAALLLAAPDATITKVAGFALLGLSVARSGVQIYKNLDLGYGWLDKENVIEGLSIVTAFMGASGSVMRAVGAEARAVRPMMYRVGNILVIGSLTGDVGTLVYATEDAIAALKAAEGDPTLSEGERNAQTIRVISSLLMSGTLIFVTNRGLFKELRASEFIKTKLPTSEDVTFGKATRLDIELEMRKAGADPASLRKMDDRQLLSSFLLMQRRQVASKRLADLRNGLTDAAKAEFDAMRMQYDTPEAFAAVIEKMTDPKGHFEDLAAKKKAGGGKPAPPVVPQPVSKPPSKLAAAMERLNKLDPDTRVEVSPDRPLKTLADGTIEVAPESQARINRQIDIHPDKLAEMSDTDVKDMLRATRELDKVGGDTTKLSDESKKILGRLSGSGEGKHRLRFEYQRKQADALLEQLGLKEEPIFKNMTDAERNRVYDGVVMESVPKGAPNLRAQAANYSMSRKPKSAREFVDHFQFYVEKFKQRGLAAIGAYQDRVSEVSAEKLAEWKKTHTGDPDAKEMAKLRSQAEAAVRKEKGITGKVDEFFYGQTEKEMAAAPDQLGKVNDATKKSIGISFDELVKETLGRTGGAKIEPGLPYDQAIHKIQALSEVPFGSETAAAYHTEKHKKILPTQEQTGKPFNDYMASATQTIKGADPIKVTSSVTQDGNARSFVFSREISDTKTGKTYTVNAIVIVTNDGRVILATYL